MTVPLVSSKAAYRVAARCPFHGRIGIQLSDNQCIVGEGIDISVTGLALHGPHDLAAGTHCKVQFSLALDDGSVHSMMLAGIIVNSAFNPEHETFRLGFQFYSVPAPYRETLHKYLAAQIKSGRELPVPRVAAGAERREAPRCIFADRIDLRLPDDQLLVGQGIDISARGLALYGPRNLAAGTHCQLQFSLRLHDGSVQPMRLEGVIVSSVLNREYGTFRLGLQFHDLPPPYRETLHQYLATQIKLGREVDMVSALTASPAAPAAPAEAAVPKPRPPVPAAGISKAPPTAALIVRASPPELPRVRETSVARPQVPPRMSLRELPRVRETSVPPPQVRARTSLRVLAIGASTGGTTALEDLLKAMPPDLPGTVVSQHMPELFTGSFARRLAKETGLDVREAQEGDALLPGRVLIAPGNRHLLLVRLGGRYQVSLRDGPAVNRHKPSVDVMFSSVAKTAGRHAIGVILTGMGRDGAQGLLEMREAGAFTIAQDEASCVVFGMPKAAIDIDAVDEVVGLANIPGRLVRLFKRDTGEKT